MSSKLETSSASNLLNNKINIMLAGLNKDFANFQTKTKEDIVVSFNEVVRKFYSTLEEPLFNYRELKEGKEPNIEELNASFVLAKQDLEIIYEEMASIRNKLASNFNAINAMSLRVKSSIAQASSDLLDYSIQNTQRFQPTFSDSFYTLAKVESDESIYKKDKVFVDTKNSRLVLPLDSEAENLKVKRIQIIDDSIGTSGNNQEIGAVTRDNLKYLFDSNMDTWFEFEQVSRNEITTPTVLHVKIEMESERIFNLLEVACIPMPNGTYPAISSIRGSVDDSIYFDLMPFYQGDIVADSKGNKVIQLSPNANNPTDENILYFFPKKIKYLTIKFIEDASYFIRTPAGIRNRTAIGIKEVKPKAQRFKSEGQFLSANFLSDKEISKIALFTEEVLPENFDTTIDYFISVDNGKNWDAIAASQKVSDKPEVLNFNIDFLEGSKTTEIPVKSIKLKADIKLAQSSDDTSIKSAFKEVKKTEFLSISPGTKSIQLEKQPIGALSVYQINYGSVGSGSFFKVTDIVELSDRIIAKLPLEVFAPNSIKENQEVIYAENTIWNRVGSLDGSAATDYDYEFDYINNVITFYKLDTSNNREGKQPQGDILFKLERENPSFSNTGDGYLVQTKFMHDGIKEKIKLYKILEDNQTKTVRIKNLSTIHKLGISEIQSVSVTTDVNGKLLEEKPYVNGVLELEDNGDYSIDKEKGILYTFNQIGASEEVIVSVIYKEQVQIPFDIKDGLIKVETSNHKPDNKTISVEVVSPLYVVDLGIKNMIKGTIEFSALPNSLVTEVAFDQIEEKFQDLDIEGPYAIDYSNGILYSKQAISGLISGLVSAADYYIEYNISRKIPQSAYSIDKTTSQVVFTDDYVLDYFNERELSAASTPLFKLEYGYADEIKESSGELMGYVTPFVNSYKIIATPKDVLV